jgi:hypothetical protein
MSCRLIVLAVALALAPASIGLAQQPKQPLPIAVVDVRAASVGLPTAEGWTPPVPDGTLVPGRNYGLDAGAHIYMLRARRVALGFGAALVIAQGTTSPPEPVAGSGPSATPEVSTRLRILAPQVSFNFGHRFGWSYLSTGLGGARVSSDASRPLTPTSPAEVEIGWSRSINYGGGARWFINEHLAVNLDLRWHTLPSMAATATQPATGSETLVVAGGGISFK